MMIESWMWISVRGGLMMMMMMMVMMVEYDMDHIPLYCEEMGVEYCGDGIER